MSKSAIVLKKTNELANEDNLRNASALLALLHGKSDSLCRLFNKEIIVGKNDVKSLNDSMISKLSLHNIGTITTSIDVSFSNKRIISFKSWDEFEVYDFSAINSPTKSLFIQWDFFANINGYEIPQRHTVSIRITTTPNPSDVFKVLLSGGFDEASEFDMQSATMICKVDFINNTLAEELVNVASSWNDLCECAYSKKGNIRPFLQLHRSALADIFHLSSFTSFFACLAIVLKILFNHNIIIANTKLIVYLIVFSQPLMAISSLISKNMSKNMYEKFGNLMEMHIFRLSKGDEKENIRIEEKGKYVKELVIFILNTLITVVVSFAFFIIG